MDCKVFGARTWVMNDGELAIGFLDFKACCCRLDA